MVVIVYGKPAGTCDKCDKAKEHLGHMKVDYTFILAEKLMEHHEGWRTDGSVERAAFYAGLDNNEKLPVFEVNGELFNYPNGMGKVKELLRQEKKT
jgi:glutaredoxin